MIREEKSSNVYNKPIQQRKYHNQVQLTEKCKIALERVANIIHINKFLKCTLER